MPVIYCCIIKYWILSGSKKTLYFLYLMILCVSKSMICKSNKNTSVKQIVSVTSNSTLFKHKMIKQCRMYSLRRATCMKQSKLPSCLGRQFCFICHPLGYLVLLAFIPSTHFPYCPSSTISFSLSSMQFSIIYYTTDEHLVYSHFGTTTNTFFF